MMAHGNKKRFRGWSLSSVSWSEQFNPRDLVDLRQILESGRVLPIGSGRSFGDVALNNDGCVVDVKSLAPYERIDFDSKAGILCCAAGVTQRDILEKFAPKGWIIPSIPGSSEITIGGAVAADAHGKNHHMHGSISNHLVSFEIMLAGGEVVEASRNNLSDLFWATIGGLGLTGIILRVRLRLKRTESCYAIQKMVGFGDVDEMVDIIEATENRYEYLLGWVDGSFKSGSQWKGVVLIGRNAASDEVCESWRLPSRKSIRLPFANPIPRGGVLAGWVLNKAIGFRFKHGRSDLLDFNRLFFPQDSVKNWNFVFGTAGFVDYQCCVPFPCAREFLKDVHRLLNKHRISCFLVVIKRFQAPEVDGPLTFAQNGISIALDIPLRREVLEVLTLLDEIVFAYGGRINLVKDSRLSSQMFRKIYPRFNEWRLTKYKYDPRGIFRSDLSRRLGLLDL